MEFLLLNLVMPKCILCYKVKLTFMNPKFNQICMAIANYLPDLFNSGSSSWLKVPLQSWNFAHPALVRIIGHLPVEHAVSP